MIQVAVFVSPQTLCSSLSQTGDAFSLASRLAGQRLFALQRLSVDGQAGQDLCLHLIGWHAGAVTVPTRAYPAPPIWPTLRP